MGSRRTILVTVVVYLLTASAASDVCALLLAVLTLGAWGHGIAGMLVQVLQVILLTTLVVASFDQPKVARHRLSGFYVWLM